MPQILTHVATIASAADERVKRSARIVLPHERLADQECIDTDRLHACQLGGRMKAALGDERDVFRAERSEAAGRIERGFERMEVPVVDADEFRAGCERALEF